MLAMAPSRGCPRAFLSGVPERLPALRRSRSGRMPQCCCLVFGVDTALRPGLFGFLDTISCRSQAANGATHGATSPAATRSKKPKISAAKAATDVPSSGRGAGANPASGAAAEAKPMAARDTVQVTRSAVRQIVEAVLKQVRRQARGVHVVFMTLKGGNTGPVCTIPKCRPVECFS